MNIVEFDRERHLEGVRRCVIELQDFEREFEARLPTGDEIVEEYVPNMFKNCKECDGQILVAEDAGSVVGYALIMSRVISDEIEDGGLEYGLVSDLVVTESHRRKGVGRQLLDASEEFARGRGTKWLRIGVLAKNALALDMYEGYGFSKLYVELEKDLGK